MDEEDGRSAGKGIQVSKKAMRSIDSLSKNLSKTFCFKATSSIVLFRFSWRFSRCTMYYTCKKSSYWWHQYLSRQSPKTVHLSK